MKMGRYCKAYPVARLRQFEGWVENLEDLRKETDQDGSNDVPRMLTDEDHLFLQENFVVTDDIFIDQNIVFENVTPEWIDFCKNTLEFEVPDYESSQVEEAGV